MLSYGVQVPLMDRAEVGFKMLPSNIGATDAKCKSTKGVSMVGLADKLSIW